MRQKEALGAHTRRLHRTAKEIITPEEYEHAVRSVIDIIEDDNVPAKVRLSAIQLLMAYIEGKPTERIEHLVANGATIRELLEQ